MSEQKMPENFRAYGILMREGRILISAEHIGEIFCWKFPGGRVEDGESAENALIREFWEEATLDIWVEHLLHSPGTLLSPWTGANYTPIYFKVSGLGEIKVPAHEPLELTFKKPGQVLSSELVAEPEKHALNRLLEKQS